MLPNPYAPLPRNRWSAKTAQLIDAHPLGREEVVEYMLESWHRIMTTEIGGELRLGEEYKPSPQMMGNWLHAIFGAMVERDHPGIWRKEQTAQDKDIVYIPDDAFSTEVKTSSNPTQIFANRSYAQPQGEGGKSKDGYYIAVNTEKFGDTNNPRIRRVSMGWLSHEDWIPQASATGQQARLAPETYRDKFEVLYQMR